MSLCVCVGGVSGCRMQRVGAEVTVEGGAGCLGGVVMAVSDI